jgi:hypothetical protein
VSTLCAICPLGAPCDPRTLIHEFFPMTPRTRCCRTIRAVKVASSILLVAIGYWVATRSEPSQSNAPALVGSATIGRKGIHTGTRAHADRPTESPSRAGGESRFLSGVVRSSTGRLIVGATVCLSSAAPHCCAEDRCRATDARGRFSLPAGEAERALIASAPDHLSQQLAIDSQRVATGFEFFLDAANSTVSGYVQDASGGVIVEAWVAAAANGAATSVTRSDSDGRFSLALPPGPVVVTARAEGYSVARQNLTAPAEDVHLVLAPGSSVVGRVVVDGTDEPVEGVSVTAINSDGLRTELEPTVSDHDGEFRFEALAAGHYELLAVGSRWRGSPVSVSVAHGQITDEILVPVIEAISLSAIVRVAGEACREGSLVARGANVAFSRIGAHGAAQLDALLPGRYEIEVQCPPGVPEREVLDVGTESVTRVWDLKPGLELRGRVETVSGRLLQGIAVGVAPVGARGTATTCVTDSAGEFVCTGLVVGEYSCETYSDGARSEVVHVVVDGAVESKRIVLRSEASGRIHVSIPEVSEPSAVPWQIFAESRERLPKPVQASIQDGIFVFEQLPLGQYLVYAGTRDGPASATASLDTDGQVARVTLPAPARGAISGRVIDAVGTPVIDAWVRAFVSDPVWSGSHPVGASALTDDRGMFTLGDLWRGRYDLEVSGSSGNVTAKGIDTNAGETLIRLAAFGSLSVLVRDAADRPVPTFQLAYERENGPGALLHGQGGMRMLPSLAPDTYTLTAWSAAGSASQTLRLASGASASVRLTLDPSAQHAAAYMTYALGGREPSSVSPAPE